MGRSSAGVEIERAYVDKGYRGHDTENPRRVFISEQKRGVFGVMKTLPKVASEMALSILAYNLTRVMNIVGTRALLAAIRA